MLALPGSQQGGFFKSMEAPSGKVDAQERMTEANGSRVAMSMGEGGLLDEMIQTAQHL